MNKQDLLRFESLGDNCEFGFVQRSLGLDPGGLLRWAISNPASLVSALQDNFREVYLWENLTPSYRDMVYDSRYGLYFHTKMYSENNIFIEPEDVRRKIYEDEVGKVKYLVEKLIKNISYSYTICVYEVNDHIPAVSRERIAAEIKRLGESSLLFVEEGNPVQVGTIDRLDNKVYRGYIDQFAPYEEAARVSIHAWEKLITSAINTI